MANSPPVQSEHLRRLRPWRLAGFRDLSVLVFVLLAAVTAAVTVFAHVVVANQEHKLLTERANEVNLILTNSVSSTETEMALLARDAATGGVASFNREAQVSLASSAGTNPDGYALARIDGSAVSVVAAVGHGIRSGSTLTGEPASAVRGASAISGLTATRVYLSEGTRAVGFAYGAGPNMAVFRQILVGPPRAPRQAGTAPFSELRVVLYASDSPDTSQVLVTTTNNLPLHGAIRYVPLMAGKTKWLTAVNATHALVGSLTAFAQWLSLAIGLVASVLVFLLLEALARRRDAAISALEQEHRFAETLQRRLLPTIPQLKGLDIASSYVTGSDIQAVGGDWFDVFELPTGQVGVVIGDVMGHDVEAAAIMAQLRAALRGFASEGGDPASIVQRLGRFLDVYAIPGVVTVVYGILETPSPDGSRRFVWANAGHLPPLVREPDGRVLELSSGSSPLLGAPGVAVRPAAEHLLTPGSVLVLYTDGLVESRGEDLNQAVEQLRTVISGINRTGAEGICAAVLDAHLASTRRDDVALLVINITSGRPESGRITAEALAGS